MLLVNCTATYRYITIFVYVFAHLPAQVLFHRHLYYRLQ